MAISAGTIEALLRLRDEMSPALKRVEKGTRELGSVVSGAGQAMLPLSLALATIGGGAIKAATDFESSFAGVRKTVNATQEEFEALEAGFRGMAQEIPVSVNELNRVGEAAGQLGISTENILGFTRTMADLGVTTNLSADEAATQLARLANITQMPQDQFDRLGSTVVALGNNLATTESEIVEFGLRIAGAGAQVGLSEAEILSMGAALSSVGINAEAGGTAISKVMIDIASSVQSGGERLGQFAAVAGMTSDAFADMFRADAAGAIQAFISGLGNMESQGRSTLGVLEEMGIKEVRLRDALLRASGAGDLLSRSLEIGASAWAENNALTAEAEQRYATTASQLKILWNQVVDVAITLGQALLPSLRAVVEFLQGMTPHLATAVQWFTSLPAPVQGVAVALAGLIAAAGPVIIVLGSLVSSAGAVAVAVGGLGLTLSGALPIVAGIAAAIAALVVIWQNWDSVVTVTKALFEAFRPVLELNIALLQALFVAPALAVFDALNAVVRTLTFGFIDFAAALQNAQLIGDALRLSWTALQFTAVNLGIAALEAKKFLLFDGDPVKAETQKAIDGMRALKLELSDTANQIVSGTAPAVAQGAGAIGEAESATDKLRQQLSATVPGLGDMAGAFGAGGTAAKTMADRVAELRKSLEDARLQDMAKLIVEGAKQSTQFLDKAISEAVDGMSGAMDDMDLSGAFPPEIVGGLPTLEDAAKKAAAEISGLRAEAANAEAVARKLAETGNYTAEEIEKVTGVTLNATKGAKAWTAELMKTVQGFGAFGPALGGLAKSIGGWLDEQSTNIVGKMSGIFGQGGLMSSVMSGGLGVLFGPAGPLMGIAQQGLSALQGLIGKGVAKLGDAIKGLFGGPSAEELAGRDLVADFEDSLIATLDATQLAEAGGERWKQTVIAVRDAYIAAGHTAAEAEAAVAKLWESSREGPEATAAAIAEIEAVTGQANDALDEMSNADLAGLATSVDAETLAANTAALEAGAVAASDAAASIDTLTASGLQTVETFTLATEAVRSYSAALLAIPQGVTFPVPTDSTGPPPPGFAEGTGGRFLDFGAGTPVVLHGRERVMTEAEGRGGFTGGGVSVDLGGVSISVSGASGNPQAIAEEVLARFAEGLEQGALPRIDAAVAESARRALRG